MSKYCTAIDSILAAFDDIEEGAVLLCWLPLANLFQRVINFFAIARGATSYMLSDPRELMNHLGSVQPHILIGVPRVFERMQAGIIEHTEKRPRLIRHLIRWAMRAGYERAFPKISGKRRGIAATISWQIADKLALRRLRGVFGGRLRYFVSGSAAMPLWLLEWFEGIGLPVLEAYGVSENIVPIATNRFSSRKPGTVGRPLSPNQSVSHRMARFWFEVLVCLMAIGTCLHQRPSDSRLKVIGVLAISAASMRKDFFHFWEENQRLLKPPPESGYPQCA